MNLSLENKVALVTGAGSGMGLAAAQAFAAEGAAVALVDINESAVRIATERLVAAGHKAIAVRCDVANEAQVKAMVEQTVSVFGRLDAAFNNAGVQTLAVETADAASQEFDRVNATNLRSVLALHEVRIAPNAQARKWDNREQFFYRRPHRHSGPGHLSRNETRRDRVDEERSA